MARALIVALAVTALGVVSRGRALANVDAVAVDRGSPLQSSFLRPQDLPDSTQLIIGVKSAALSGFESRQTIRQTWADPRHRPRGVSVVFLACEPEWTVELDAMSSRRALDHEKAVHGNILTHELDCRDSYYTLVQKVKAFFKWIHDRSPGSLSALAYVMITDDDVYVDVPALRAMLFSTTSPNIPRRRLYAGQVIQSQFGVALHPLRDPRERNYVPLDVYPLSDKPHFATGAHYVLSTDLVEFIGRNSAHLQGVGTLEDVSVGFWLASLRGVRPSHLPEFDNVRFTVCHNALIAYADLSRLAMFRIHANRIHNRRLCDGFDAADWDKRGHRLKTKLPQPVRTNSVKINRHLHHHWDLQLDTVRSMLHIQTTISLDDDSMNETAVAIYVPAKDTFDAFCGHLLYVVEMALPTTAISLSFCIDFQSHLASFLTSASFADPPLKHVYVLAQGNLQEDGDSLALFVQLAPSLAKRRTLIECLMVASFKGLHISVLSIVDHEARLNSITPDIIVTTPKELTLHYRARSSRVVPRTIILRGVEDTEMSDSLACRSETTPGIIEVSSFFETPLCHGHQLYIPIASQSFTRRYKHSPLALLHAAPRRIRPHGRSILITGCQNRFAVVSAAVDILRQALEENNLRVDDPLCDVDHPGHTLDVEVVRFRQYRFVVIVEDRWAVPGHVSHEIVSAFLAGAVPIYVGHSATVSWIFNARAFVDCGWTKSSLRECAAHVSQVALDQNAFDAMRSTSPVVNQTAFFELFSWHPDVAERVGHIPALGLGERLRSIINNT